MKEYYCEPYIKDGVVNYFKPTMETLAQAYYDEQDELQELIETTVKEGKHLWKM